MKPFILKEEELSGFELGGWKDIKTNKITMALSNRVIDKWPTEIDFFGNIYTLELVKQGGKSNSNNTIWEAAYYA